MLRLTRNVDYAILILSEMIHDADRGKDVSSTKDLAQACHLSQPMVAKILKSLQREHLIQSVRGLRGGYSLSPETRTISLGALIRALDGPIRLTDCAPQAPAGGIGCDLHQRCSVRGTLLRVNDLLAQAFEAVTLREIAYPDLQPPRGIPLPSRRTESVSGSAP